MPERSSQEEKIVERLTDLTMKGELPWEAYYGNVDPQSEGFDEMSEPKGYLLLDNEHGFGVVTLRLHDPMEEIIEDPRVFIGGDALEVSSTDVEILLDAVRAHLGEVRSGEKPSKQKRKEQKIEAARKPLKQRIEELKTTLQEERQRVNSLLESVHNLSAQSSVPLTAETFRRTLRNYIDGSEWFDDAKFEEAFNENKAQTAIEKTHARE